MGLLHDQLSTSLHGLKDFVGSEEPAKYASARVECVAKVPSRFRREGLNERAGERAGKEEVA